MTGSSMSLVNILVACVALPILGSCSGRVDDLVAVSSFTQGNQANEDYERYGVLVATDRKERMRLAVFQYHQGFDSLQVTPKADFCVQNDGRFYIDNVAQPLKPGLNVYYLDEVGLREVDLTAEDAEVLLVNLKMVCAFHGKGLQKLIKDTFKTRRDADLVKRGQE